MSEGAGRLWSLFADTLFASCGLEAADEFGDGIRVLNTQYAPELGLLLTFWRREMLRI
ncbi:MAG: hypothetical protein WC956_08560 [bacterium]